ncbi:MAG: hypothetical protein JST04_13380 [Bdellovibrionales bacterium]|nr:hypothetical protein [Bdellovibrionales bacterium]
MSAAFAVPTDQEAWSNLEQKITVYRDSVDSNIYWFVPKISFEASAGKTLLKRATGADGKIQYTTRIIPYFSADLREEVAQNISNIRQQSQLKPVVARSIGVALPDFNYKFMSPSVTNYDYLDVPRLVRFSLDAAEAKEFDELYSEPNGVPVEFSVTYDSVMNDKMLNIDVNCKEMDRELANKKSLSLGGSAKVKGVKAYLGADIESAFLNSVQNKTNGVNISSKGDIAGMQEMIRRVMNLCFDPVDGYGGYYDDYYNDDRYPTRRTDDGTTDPDTDFPTRTGSNTGRGDVIDDNFSPKNQLASVGMVNRSGTSNAALAAAERAQFTKFLNNLSLDKKLVGEDCDPKKDRNCPDDPFPSRGDDNTDTDNTNTSGGGLLPSATLKAGFKFKSTALTKNNQAVVKQISWKDATATKTVVDIFTANAKSIEKVQVTPLADKNFTVTVKNPASTPLSTGIRINQGEQYSINAAFVFKSTSAYSGWGSNKAYAWDAAWDKPDGDLYYRLGSGDWTPVNARAIITSDVTRGGGELQFYLDRSAIFNHIPEKLRKGGFLSGPVFTIDGIAPEFSVQVTGRRISVK